MKKLLASILVQRSGAEEKQGLVLYVVRQGLPIKLLAFSIMTKQMTVKKGATLSTRLTKDGYSDSCLILFLSITRMTAHTTTLNLSIVSSEN
jgi:hypothetical protein